MTQVEAAGLEAPTPLGVGIAAPADRAAAEPVRVQWTDVSGGIGRVYPPVDHDVEQDSGPSEGAVDEPSAVCDVHACTRPDGHVDDAVFDQRQGFFHHLRRGSVG